MNTGTLIRFNVTTLVTLTAQEAIEYTTTSCAVCKVVVTRAVFVKFQQGGSAECEARSADARVGESFLGRGQRAPSPPARASGGAL